MKRRRPQGYYDHIKSDYWGLVRKAIYARAGWQCERCGTDRKYAVLEVHHDNYDHLGEELDHLDELRLLCRDCHGHHHGRSEYDPRAIMGPGGWDMLERELRKL